MGNSFENAVTVVESGNGPYAQFVTAGRHVLGADEPEALGGRDTGPSPYEYILAGLGACTAMTLRMYATRQRWPLRRTAVRLRHEKILGPDGRSKIDQFEREIHLEGDLTSEQRQRLLEIAEKCPVSQTLRRPSIIVSRLSQTPVTQYDPAPAADV
jgi:putative redox protein